MSRQNLYPNPSFRSGLANTTPLNGAALSISTEYAFSGTHSLMVTKSDSNNSGFTSTVPIPVGVGLPYAASAYVRLPNTLPAEESANLILRIQWRDSANTVISTDSSGVYVLEDDTTWVRLSGVWAAPVGATVAFIEVAQVQGGTDGAVFYVDAILVEQINYVGGYFDNLSQAEKVNTVNKALSAVPSIFNGVQLNADVTINELVLNTVDEAGTIWVCEDIDGWWGHSSPESPDIPRGTEDGSYDVSGRYAARILVLEGVFFPANNGPALSAAIDRLVTATNLVRQGGWIRTNEDPTKAAFVRLSGRPKITTLNARGKTRFSIGLKAADPIKYEWNDSDPEGFTHVELTAADSVGPALNKGTATVAATFTVEGPLGAGSTIYNSLTDQTLTIVQSLRGRGPVGDVTKVAVSDNIATITTSANHQLIEGDEIIISGVGSPFDSIDTTYTILAASQVFPYTLSFLLPSDNIDEVASGGQVQLTNNDVLVIDTYDRSVTFNGVSTGNRNKLETLTDWITLAPGENLIGFSDDIDHMFITKKQVLGNIATLTSSDTHYLIPGEDVVVALNEEAELSKKSLTSNVVTLTTKTAHGFSVGDLIDVDSTEISTVDQKSASTTVATLRTVDTSGVSVSDVIVVNLPATATPSNKALTSNVVTITTQAAHGFSADDSVTVTLPASATVSNKALTSNQATLSTATAHGFQIGDSITVALGTSANITVKAKAGAQAVITTAAAHGFSVGDSVVVALPATATLTDVRAAAGETGQYLMTLNTTAAHNFSVGDRITVDIGLPTSYATTTRASAGTTRTLGVASGQKYSVGERITVTGLTADYNGTYYLTAVTTNSLSYVASGALTESSTAAVGTVTNNTVITSYNGTKVISTVPTSTSLTYVAYDQAQASSSTAAGSGASLTNTTNQSFNGTKTLVSVTSTQFAYNL